MAVTGIGGVFFRAQDPAALSAWYAAHFGVINADYQPWLQAAGPTMIVPFSADTDYFPPGKSWMQNFRVDDIDATIAALQASGIEVVTKPEWDAPETGRFARLMDPEGNAIELWQPPQDEG
jgi:predicted enzyme related to lactoylglutathione lyase